MKIFECSDSFLPIVDGVGRVVKAYAEALSKRGNEVYVVTSTDDIGYRGGLPYDVLDYASIKVSKNFPWKAVDVKVMDFHFNERIKWIQPDIIHVHSPGTAGHVGLSLAEKKHVPLIGSFHSKYYDDFLKVTHSKILSKIGADSVAEFYEHCDEVWAVSENASETLHSYGFKGNIKIMPNGTNIRTLNGIRVDDVASEYGIRRNCPVFLFVGQLDWKKNIMRILDSCGALNVKGIDFQLILAGQGADREHIIETAKRIGIADKLVMTGHIQDVEVLDCIYHLATLLLFPSLYDTASMVLREAACMKTPGLVIEGSGPAEVVNNLENGLVCRDTTDDVVNAIISFLDLSEEKKNLMGINACNTIPVSWDDLMDNIEYRYRSVIETFNHKRSSM